jgi:hypothetical protein
MRALDTRVPRTARSGGYWPGGRAGAAPTRPRAPQDRVAGQP